MPKDFQLCTETLLTCCPYKAVLAYCFFRYLELCKLGFLKMLEGYDRFCTIFVWRQTNGASFVIFVTGSLRWRWRWWWTKSWPLSGGRNALANPTRRRISKRTGCYSNRRHRYVLSKQENLRGHQQRKRHIPLFGDECDVVPLSLQPRQTRCHPHSSSSSFLNHHYHHHPTELFNDDHAIKWKNRVIRVSLEFYPPPPLCF